MLFIVYTHVNRYRNVGGMFVFSAPELKAQVHYCDHVVRRPSVRASVHRR